MPPWPYQIKIDTCPSFLYALALSGEKAINALKSAMVVVGVPWILKTDNGPAYAFQQFNNFPGSWEISLTTSISCNSQEQTIVERMNRTLKELLAKTVSPEARRDPLLALTEVLLHMNFLSFEEKGLCQVYKHWESLPRNTPQPLVGWRNPISLQWQPPAPLQTHERGYACVIPQTSTMPL